MATLPIGNPALQVYTARSFSGMTEQNHLSNAFLTQPDQIGSVLAYAMSDTYYNKSGSTSIIPLLTGGIGNTMTVENREYQWDVHGQNERTITIIATTGDGGTTPGYGNSPFRVVFEEKWFSPADVIRADDGTMCRIQEEPYAGYGGTVYSLQLAENGDGSKYIDPTQIAAGAKFRKMYSTVEEFSLKGGGTNFTAPFKLKNQLSTLRKHHAVTRSAATDVLIIELSAPNDPNKRTKYWVRLAEWTFMAQWFKEKDLSAIYSKYNKDSQGTVQLPGQNGRPVYHGAGIRQQISPANIRYYNELTYNMLDDTLLDLSYNANKNGGNHKFVALTGKMGMRMFSDAVNNKFKSLGVTIVNEGRFISGSGNELVFTGDQWITANFPNGTSLTVKEFAPYDDLILHGTLHPVSLRPIESYRFTILNFGTNGDGKSNIQKVVKRDSEDMMWHVAGSIDPTANPAKSLNTSRSSGIDGFEIHALSEEGIVMKDPTASAELIFSLD
jgi:hypothetical protein